MSGHRGRDIPWLSVVRFHKEIVARAEQGFFSLNGRDDQAERWTSLKNFDPDDLAGPWTIDPEQLRSRPFRLELDQKQHESIFLGGPCYLGWTKSLQGSWIPQWRPLLYREIEVRAKGSNLVIVPKQGTWSVTPLLQGLFDRLEITLNETLDDFAARLVEKSVGYRRHENVPLSEAVLRAIISDVPDVEVELTKDIRDDTFRVQPTPWILFAPTNSFSALTRYLMRDYERLEHLIEESPRRVGGLKLLEDHPVDPFNEEVEVLPLIPLNDSQRAAVQRILEERPLTVISGPPGTGKSQVVVALLLNAWARGQTVLFASNNNKAVDVVRERVERFESEFPIAVRAGAKQKQNIQEVLRRTLNMASLNPTKTQSAIDGEEILRKRTKLLERMQKNQSALDTKLPQRVDEARRTALRAYGEYRTTIASIAEQDRVLDAQKVELGFEGCGNQFIASAVADTRGWLNGLRQVQTQIDGDDRQKQKIREGILERERQRNRAAEEVGLAATDAGDWKWLSDGPGPELIADWGQRLRQLLDAPVEQALEPIVWHADFDRWRSAEQAEQWSSEAREFAEFVLRTCAELIPKLEEIERVSAALEGGRLKVQSHGIPVDMEAPLDDIRNWIADFAEYTTCERSRFDMMPWSRRSLLRRRLRFYERQLRSYFPLEIWTRIGTLNDSGRESLAPIFESVRRWIELRREWRAVQTVADEVEIRFGDLRSQAAALRLRDVPNSSNIDSWTPIVAQCEEGVLLADGASLAWRKRKTKEDVEAQLRELAKEWERLASGMPIKESWRRGQGKPFDAAIRELANAPSGEHVSKARMALYSGALNRLLECWNNACVHEDEAGQLRSELADVPGPAVRLEEWWKQRPKNAIVLESAPSDWPDAEQAQERVDQVHDWCQRRCEFDDRTRSAMTLKAQTELGWAVEKLQQAVEVLPDGPGRLRASALIDGILGSPEDDWPISDLNDAFAEFSPDRIMAMIQRIESELERSSFEDAKTRWIERLQSDDVAIQAVDQLERTLHQHRGVVIDEEYETFRTALRAVPIWITTAQASQAIPLEPDLFDIVVIDEASQCTLTNLLPLLYRGRTLAIIGDDKQLPAISTIQESEELVLAQKHQIEAHISVVGHACNDVYRTATASLPRRWADVLMLEEHFRSHPQIIGFSNRHIYQKRLELKKDPSWGRRLSVGAGVHMVQVAGTALRGSNGRSWVNTQEAEQVIALVQRLRSGDSRELSLGVVTPFFAQKELLRERLDHARLAEEVLVDTAYGFQGDERDVIIFSPVVAKGITASASRWVESPPNLINVAITRAREALFMVGDLDYCRQQDGILRKLALYCCDIQTLRETSEAELELFSWMMVKGWEPKVHARIGDIEVDFTLENRNSGRRLAIEVDGRQHAATVEQDKARDAYLQGQGYEVQRIPAREIFETPFDVVHGIETWLNADME